MRRRLGISAVLLALAAGPGCGGSQSDTRPAGGRRAATAQEGWATWYGPGLEGHRTANGERFDPDRLTAAHRTLAFGTRVEVTNLDNGRTVVVRINDRGPYAGHAIIDLSQAAARVLKMIGAGRVRVRLEPLP
jgi:rare lipoprotein A